MNRLEIRIPATSANLGPGYDCLGLALKLYNRAVVRYGREAALLEPDRLMDWAAGLPAGQKPVALAYAHYAARHSCALPPIEIEFGGDIPIARGLGSSATCALAGLLAAQLIDEGTCQREELLTLASELEGHPDNAAPAVFGGLVLSMKTPDGIRWTKLPCRESLRVFLFIPSFRLSTDQARRVLPDRVPHGEAAATAASLAFLLQGLATGDGRLVAAGCQDFLHQPYRRHLIPDYQTIETLAVDAGCHLLALSGAGPSLIGLFAGPDEEGKKIAEKIRDRLPSGWQLRELPVDQEGLVFDSEPL